jgi:hypothetical protein
MQIAYSSMDLIPALPHRQYLSSGFSASSYVSCSQLLNQYAMLITSLQALMMEWILRLVDPYPDEWTVVS